MPPANSVSRPRQVDAARRRFLARTLAADPPRASSLVVTVWGDAIVPLARDGGLWLRSLIRLLAPLGINERLARTSVYRLARDGWLVASAHGRESRYRLTPSGRARFAAAYRRIYTPHADVWNDGWDVIVLPPEALPPAARDEARNALQWAGFGALAPGVHVRPSVAGRGMPSLPGPRRSAKSRRAAVIALSAHDAATPSAHALAASAPALWPLAELGARYRAFLDHYGPALEWFRKATDAADYAEQCFVARTLLIHAYRRTLLRDPLLPAGLLPLNWPGAAAYALARDAYRLLRRPADAHVKAVLGDARATPADGTERFP
ncbi:MAG: phenylacetic acid degradation operon negative regulatory protein PaaX [Proteobacteria bacterium]|nr:phenylacetic acid degradation operon negative regulatory protein PaaX [Pseudomonadota bacterium]